MSLFSLAVAAPGILTNVSKLLWFHFFSGDWLKDPQLSMCAPATRGIWIDAICAMRECQCGSLTGTPDQLARVLRCSAFDLRIALNDLATTGAAIVRERNGLVTLTNRRYERELKTKELNKIRQQNHRAKNDVTQVSRECNTNVTSDSLSDSEIDILEKEKGCGERKKPIDPLFQKFWEAYPRREAKAVALEKFKKLNPDEALLETMLAWIAEAKQSAQWLESKQFIPLPQTWLNQRRWEGDPPPKPPDNPAIRAPAGKTSVLDAELARLKAEKAAMEASCKNAT